MHLGPRLADPVYLRNLQDVRALVRAHRLARLGHRNLDAETLVDFHKYYRGRHAPVIHRRPRPIQNNALERTAVTALIHEIHRY